MNPTKIAFIIVAVLTATNQYRLALAVVAVSILVGIGVRIARFIRPVTPLSHRKIVTAAPPPSENHHILKWYRHVCDKYPVDSSYIFINVEEFVFVCKAIKQVSEVWCISPLVDLQRLKRHLMDYPFEEGSVPLFIVDAQDEILEKRLDKVLAIL